MLKREPSARRWQMMVGGRGELNFLAPLCPGPVPGQIHLLAIVMMGSHPGVSLQRAPFGSLPTTPLPMHSLPWDPVMVDWISVASQCGFGDAVMVRAWSQSLGQAAQV